MDMNWNIEESLDNYFGKDCEYLKWAANHIKDFEFLPVALPNLYEKLSKSNSNIESFKDINTLVAVVFDENGKMIDKYRVNMCMHKNNDIWEYLTFWANITDRLDIDDFDDGAISRAMLKYYNSMYVLGGGNIPLVYVDEDEEDERNIIHVMINNISQLNITYIDKIAHILNIPEEKIKNVIVSFVGNKPNED